MTDWVQVVSARHARDEPVHAARRTGNGLVALCKVGAAGLAPLRAANEPDRPYRLREEGDPQHCPECERRFRKLGAAS